MLTEPLISADDHMDFNVLPPDLFVSRVPAAVRDRVPVVRDDGEGPTWYLGAVALGPSGRRSKSLVTDEDPGFRPGRPLDRLADMDRDGVHAHVVYGPPLGLPVADPELRAHCQRAYNDWAAEFNATAPDRLVVLALLPGYTPAAATDELRRVADLGHRGAVLGVLESDQPPFDESWEEFWSVADECALPISFHLGKGMHSLAVRPGSWRFPATVAVSPLQLDEIIVGLIFSGILERHPNVHAVFGEAGLGWIPYLLDRMDHEHEKYRDLVTDVVLPERPSTYFRRQVVLTYEEDEFGLEMIARIGSQSVMWASDYPHGDSTWPNSRASLAASQLAALAPQDRRRILWDNAARLYGIEGPDAG